MYIGKHQSIEDKVDVEMSGWAPDGVVVVMQIGERGSFKLLMRQLGLSLCM